MGSACPSIRNGCTGLLCHNNDFTNLFAGIDSFYENKKFEISIIFLPHGRGIFEEKGAYFINSRNTSKDHFTNTSSGSVITCESIKEELVPSLVEMVHSKQGTLTLSRGGVILNDNGIQISHSFEADCHSLGAPIFAIERTKNPKDPRCRAVARLLVVRGQGGGNRKYFYYLNFYIY